MLRYNRTSRAPRCRPVQNRERNVTYPVLYAVRDGIAVLTVENPPVNSLAQGVRAGLIAGLDKADAAPAVSAALIIGGGVGRASCRERGLECESFLVGAESL